ISVERWRLTMRQEIKNVHLYSAASARGGWAQLTQAELGRVGQIIGREYQYLDRFAATIRGRAYKRDGRMLARAQLYAQAGRRTYHGTDERGELENGMTEERRIAEGTGPCVDCLEQEAEGWVPIGTLVPVGARECLSNCRCTIQYR